MTAVFSTTLIYSELLNLEQWISLMLNTLMVFTNDLIPYIFVGDEAFALKTWRQRPYPGKNLLEANKIFNYRLSRARGIIENSFGIHVARWRIYHRPIQTSVETAENIVKATVCLHNYLRQTNTVSYCPSGF